MYLLYRNAPSEDKSTSRWNTGIFLAQGYHAMAGTQNQNAEKCLTDPKRRDRECVSRERSVTCDA